MSESPRGRFSIGTILFPLLMVGLILLPRLIGSRGAERTFVLVNEGPASLGDGFAAALGTRPASSDENTYRVRRIAGTYHDLREHLNAQVEAKDIDGYVVLPPDVLDTRRHAVPRSKRRAASPSCATCATRPIWPCRVSVSGQPASALPPSRRSLLRSASTRPRSPARGEERGGALSTFLAAYVVAFLTYLMTTLYGVAVMRSVLEEKTNRIAEVLMSTIRAPHLIAGKIIGVGSAAVAQVLIWVGIMALVVTQSHRLGERFALPPTALQALSIEPATGVLLFLFFLLGFFLYAAVFATVGASVTSEQEAQSVQFIALIPLVAPLIFLESILNAPLGRTATTLGLIPLTASIAMPMRMASTPVPPIEIAVSLAFLVIGIAVVAWIAGKIYRVGILSTGKRPSLSELARWIRSA